jgi:TfoX/Sxy family transcriptional regulator of competence genes
MIMPFSHSLADRVRQALSRRSGVVEKQMFGGVGFLLGGNMLVGVWKTSLIVRVGPDSYEQALQEPNVCQFDITGRPMKGWVLVEAEGIETDEQLRQWIDRATRFVAELPVK